MVTEILHRPELAFRIVESVVEQPLSIRRDTNALLVRMLNMVSESTEKKTQPSLDWLIEVLKCPSVDLKVNSLRALIEKTNDHFHICEERLNWVC